MSQSPLNVLAVGGSLHRDAVTQMIVETVAARLRAEGCAVEVLDFEKEPLGHFNPEISYKLPGYASLQGRVHQADVLLLATPDYHGCMSGVMKNFLDHFWREFAGKLFVPIVASHDKGLTVMDQIRTVARQCYAWSMPYGVAFAQGVDVKDGQIISDAFKQRLEMLIRDVRVYGEVLARQRQADLAGTEPGFLARSRKA